MIFYKNNFCAKKKIRDIEAQCVFRGANNNMSFFNR